MVQQALPFAVMVLQILANVGIIITIAFLAVQTRASTKAAEEARLRNPGTAELPNDRRPSGTC